MYGQSNYGAQAGQVSYASISPQQSGAHPIHLPPPPPPPPHNAHSAQTQQVNPNPLVYHHHTQLGVSQNFPPRQVPTSGTLSSQSCLMPIAPPPTPPPPPPPPPPAVQLHQSAPTPSSYQTSIFSQQWGHNVHHTLPATAPRAPRFFPPPPPQTPTHYGGSVHMHLPAPGNSQAFQSVALQASDLNSSFFSQPPLRPMTGPPPPPPPSFLAGASSVPHSLPPSIHPAPNPDASNSTPIAKYCNLANWLESGSKTTTTTAVDGTAFGSVNDSLASVCTNEGPREVGEGIGPTIKSSASDNLILDVPALSPKYLDRTQQNSNALEVPDSFSKPHHSNILNANEAHGNENISRGVPAMHSLLQSTDSINAGASYSPTNSDMEMEDDITQPDEEHKVSSFCSPYQEFISLSNKLIVEAQFQGAASKAEHGLAEDADEERQGAAEVRDSSLIHEGSAQADPKLGLGNCTRQHAEGPSSFSLLQEYSSDDSLDDNNNNDGSQIEVGYVNLAPESVLIEVQTIINGDSGKSPELSIASQRVVSETSRTCNIAKKSMDGSSDICNEEHSRNNALRDDTFNATSETLDLAKDDMKNTSVLSMTGEFGSLARKGASDSDSGGDSTRYKTKCKKRENRQWRSRSPCVRVDDVKNTSGMLKIGEFSRECPSDSDSEGDSPCHTRRVKREKKLSRSRSPCVRERVVKNTPALLKIDDFGRVARECSSDSDSGRNSPRYKRRGKRERSLSRSRSPYNRRRWSPRRRKDRHGRSRSASPKRRRSRSKSPFRPGFGGRDEMRRGNVHQPECFNFKKGKCYRGASCRYFHHESDKSDRSRSYWSKDHYHVHLPSSRNSSSHEETRAHLLERNINENDNKTKTKEFSLHHDIHDMGETRVMESEPLSHLHGKGSHTESSVIAVSKEQHNVHFPSPWNSSLHEETGPYLLEKTITGNNIKIITEELSPHHEIQDMGGKNLIRSEPNSHLHGKESHTESSASTIIHIKPEMHPGAAAVAVTSSIETAVIWQSQSPNSDQTQEGVVCEPNLIADPSISEPSTLQTSTSTPTSQLQFPDFKQQCSAPNLPKPPPRPSFPASSYAPSTLPAQPLPGVYNPKQQLNSAYIGNFPMYQPPLPPQQSHFQTPLNSSWNSLPPAMPPPISSYSFANNAVGNTALGPCGATPSHFQQSIPLLRNNFVPASSVMPYPAPLPNSSQVGQLQAYGHSWPSKDVQTPPGHTLPHGDLCIPSSMSYPYMQQISSGVPNHSGPANASLYSSDYLDRNLKPLLPDFGGSRISSYFNPYASTFDQPLTSKISSDAPREGDGMVSSDKNCGPQNFINAPADGRQVESLGSQNTPPNSARAANNMLSVPGDDRYNPLFDSIEPPSISFCKPGPVQNGAITVDTDVMTKLSKWSNCPLDVEENNMQKGGGTIAMLASAGNDEYGETADAEVGTVENRSPSDSNDLADMVDGEREIDNAETSKKSKDSRSMRLFKNAIAAFVKELLKPSWRQGSMSKEVFKTIVKKTVEKVSGAMKNRRVPKSQEKIDHFVDSSQRKLTQLVMGYVDRYVKP
ncbi:hypothetical protein DM860_011631 [Cuscuta australis]|uniref:C3H1-type domain-containing protein n=1 Tax=Cuscuta australis TaxID=267555 RepID=A0A328D071_9ASTE|nr:hypothetical protein DM860_011631 [Cuscuta australis]